MKVLDFVDVNHTFKMKWWKEYLKNLESLWYFIPNNIFKKVGCMQFLLQCNYNVSKRPMKVSATGCCGKTLFCSQLLPHKTIIWDNECIVSKNTSIFLKHWVDKKLIYLADLQNEEGQIFNYEDFLRIEGFPITYKEFKMVTNAIPSGIA